MSDPFTDFQQSLYDRVKSHLRYRWGFYVSIESLITVCGGPGRSDMVHVISRLIHEGDVYAYLEHGVGLDLVFVSYSKPPSWIKLLAPADIAKL